MTAQRAEMRTETYLTKQEVWADTQRSIQIGHRAIFEGFMILEQPTEGPFEGLRERLLDRVIGQDDAINTVIEAMERFPIRPESEKRPIANFAFVGPTGVGKTELAKALGDYFGGDQNAIITVECPSYSNGHAITNLIGAPASFIGYDTEPLFTKKSVEGMPRVILFDEVEKGSPQLYSVMLNIMQEGELTVNNAKKSELVSFRNTVIIMTSNVGAREMTKQVNTLPLGFGGEKLSTDTTALEQVAIRSFEDFFSPEFVGRLDKIAVFHPLTNEDLTAILDVKIDNLNRFYEQQYGMNLALSDAASQFLVETAQQQAHLGARPLVHAFEQHVQTVLGRYLGAQSIKGGMQVGIFHSSEIFGTDHPAEEPLVFGVCHDPSIRRQPPRSFMQTMANAYADQSPVHKRRTRYEKPHAV